MKKNKKTVAKSMSLKKCDYKIAKDAQATLNLPDGQTISFPLHSGSMGPFVADISSLKKVDIFTYDPGFVATASCTSKITYIDGDKGELYYRGYPIEQLAKKSNFLESCYLLYYGQLPTARQLEDYRAKLNSHTLVSERMVDFVKGFRDDAHPMSVMIALVGALAAFYHDDIVIRDKAHREAAAVRLVAKIPTIAAMSYRYSMGLPFNYPQNSLDYASNFLHMLFAMPSEKYTVNPVFAKALDRIFILHADHEQNASTSTVRLAGSTGANPFACISAGIASLWGPAHGGANEAVLKMLDQIGTVDNISKFIQGAKSGDPNSRLMGFGHRVYKNYDPRAAVMRETCKEVLAQSGLQDERLAIAVELEKIALSDDYFIARKLYPNVDFYSGIVLSAMGIATPMFTAIFAIARTIGWVSHWNELHEDPEFRIGRPRQLYLGATKRNYQAIRARSSSNSSKKKSKVVKRKK